MVSMNSEKTFTIGHVRTQNDIQTTIDLFYEYAASLNLDLSYQNFDAEMASMPGKYSPPQGELLLAKNDSGQPVGCVALRPLPSRNLSKSEFSGSVCEMKRLYVPPAGRGSGVGKALVIEIIAVAKRLGYSEMKLDTLSSMAAAQDLYRKFGFVEVSAYYETPVVGTRFLCLDLKTCTDIR